MEIRVLLPCRGGWLSWYGKGYRIGTLYLILHRQDRAMPISIFFLFFPSFNFSSFVSPTETFWLRRFDSIRFNFFFVLLPLRGGWLFVVVWCGVLSYPMLHRHRRRQRRCWAGVVQYQLPIVFPVLSFPFLLPAQHRKLTDVITLILFYPAHHLTRTGTRLIGFSKAINYLNISFFFATHTRCYLLSTAYTISRTRFSYLGVLSEPLET